MHILMLLDHNYPPDQRVENEAESLVKEGFEVTVLAVGRDERPEIETVNGVRVHRFDLPDQIRKKLRGSVGLLNTYSKLLLKYAKKAFELKPFDAIHAHDLYLVQAGILIKEEFRVPLVADLHENYVEALDHYAWSTKFPGKWVLSLIDWKKNELEWLKKADKIVTVISEMKERYLSLGFKNDKIVVIPNTPNLQAFRNFSIKNEILEKYEDRKLLLYSGGFDLHRGLETTIRAMSYIKEKHPEVLLLLVGDGRIREDLESVANKLGLNEYVKFEGWQDQSRIRSYVRSATIGLIPHLRSVQTDASIPHKLGYYMSEKLPIISTNCTSLERMVKAHKAGRIYESGNPEALAKEVMFLLENPDEASRLAENGQEAVEQEFNWDTTVQPLLKYYKAFSN